MSEERPRAPRRVRVKPPPREEARPEATPEPPWEHRRSRPAGEEGGEGRPPFPARRDYDPEC